MPGRARRGTRDAGRAVPDTAPEFVRNVTAVMIAGRGDALPVSALPCDGTFPTGTRNTRSATSREEIPVWDPELCIQCGKCAIVCPHSVDPHQGTTTAPPRDAPRDVQVAADQRTRLSGLALTRSRSTPEDCTGCGVCVEVCPAHSKTDAERKAINMEPQPPLSSRSVRTGTSSETSREPTARESTSPTCAGVQFLQPLFEFSGACAGCGETPYLKLLTQLFGDRAVIANATGCSSIYGGNLPTTPWTHERGRPRPGVGNSLFEDNAEFGLGFRARIDKQREFARELLAQSSRRTSARTS